MPDELVLGVLVTHPSRALTHGPATQVSSFSGAGPSGRRDAGACRGAVVSGPWPAQRGCLLCFFLAPLFGHAIHAAKPGRAHLRAYKKSPLLSDPNVMLV